MARLLYTATAAILLCWCSQVTFGISVRETDHNVVFINIPIAEAKLQQFFNDDLQPLVYNGSAWLAIVTFQVSKLEAELGHTFIPIPGMGGTTISKTVAFVTQKDGTREGYMLIDMDYSSSAQTFGCSATQPGVHCYHSHVSNVNGSSVEIATEDQLTLKFAYKNSSIPADKSLVKMGTELHWKYEQKGVKGSWTAGNQTGHIHAPATGITLTSFQSNIIAHRHGWPGETTLCQVPGTCFMTPMFQFID